MIIQNLSFQMLSSPALRFDFILFIILQATKSIEKSDCFQFLSGSSVAVSIQLSYASKYSIYSVKLIHVCYRIIREANSIFVSSGDVKMLKV